MAKIPLSSGFTVIPEGTYVFKITGVEYKEAFGKLTVNMETKDGKKHTERFSLLTSNGTPNQGALNAFSYFARVALNDTSVEEIDEHDLIGHFIECDVTHDVVPNKNDPNKTMTFARLGDKRPSDGWTQQSAPATQKNTARPDVRALLGL